MRRLASGSCVLLVVLVAACARGACADCGARCPDPARESEPPEAAQGARPLAQTALAVATVAPPLPSGAGDPVKTFNEWAYRFNEQRELPVLLTFGVRRYDDADLQLVIDYQGGESPDAALATVTQERLLDDSVYGERLELQFVRFDCPSCEPGPARWHLESLRRLVRCHEGRGHQDYGEEPCH